MPFVEQLTNFVALIDPQAAHDIRLNTIRTRERSADEVLKNAIILYGTQIIGTLKETNTVPLHTEKLVSSMLSSLIRTIQNHPQYRDVVGLEVSDTHVALADGTIVFKADVDGIRIMSLEEVKQIVTDQAVDDVAKN